MNPLQMPQVIDWNIARKIGMVPAAASASVTLEEWYQAIQGGWVKFPATQNPSSDPNTLDDYEEGTWTPSVSSETGAITAVGVVSGLYTKVGNLVTLLCSVTITTVGTAAGGLIITGLPFTPTQLGSSSVAGGGCGREYNNTGAAVPFHINNSPARLYCRKYDNTSIFTAGDNMVLALSASYNA